MRDAAHSALRELNLDYTITLIAGGARHNYEIVMWDKPRDSYFSIRVRWEPGLSRAHMTERVVQQLTRRLAARRAGHVDHFGERRPRRSSASQPLASATSP